MTWGFSSYETRFRWAAALWAILMTIWCMSPLSGTVRLVGVGIWVLLTVIVSIPFAWWRPRSARDVPIFLQADALLGATAEFRLLVKNLVASGYRFQTVSEAVRTPVRKSVVFTFDAGTRDIREVLLPLVRELEVKVTCFVTDRGCTDENYLKPLELQELVRSGFVELGGTMMLPAGEPTAEELHDALFKTRNWVTGVSGYLPFAFAYPTGADVEVLRPIVEEAGYRIGMTLGRVARPVEVDKYDVRRRILPAGQRPWQTYLLVTRGRYRAGRPGGR